MAINGTNDYDAQKLVPSEVIVSRTLQSKNRNWSNVVWRTGKPALDSEWNLINDANFEVVSNLIRSSTPSGWVDLGLNKYLMGNSGIPNTLQYYSNKDQNVLDIPNVVVNGWPVIVGGVDYTDTSLNFIELENAGAGATDYRDDFVFLEVFRAQVRSRDQNNNPIAQNKPSLTTIYAYGNTQYGGTNFDDDIIDENIKPSVDGIETSERVQIQYRIRVVSGVTFPDVLADGFGDTVKVQGQGANPNPQTTGYEFTNMKDILNDAGLWRAGNGDEASRTALRSVDGYTYAIPMFKISRRTQIAYSDTGGTPADAYNNQQGNATAISAITSDRPDGKFYDGIDAADVTDLRSKVSLGNINYDKIIEENLHLLLTGELKSFRSNLLQYDSVADSDINGYTDILSNEGCSGKRTLWSDAASDQEDIFGEVKTITLDNSLDVYRATGTGAWANGDTLVVQIISKLPSGTIVKATPRVYLEDKIALTTDLSGGAQISWANLNTATATMTIDDNTGFGSKDIWIYYDISIPEGQGVSHVANNMLRVNYENSASFPTTTGVVVRGQRLDPIVTNFQDLLNHTYQNRTSTEIYNETEVVNQRKQFNIKPDVQSTTVRDGTTRSLEVETTDKLNKTVIVPYPIQHIKGIYTSATAGTEVATKTPVSNIAVDDVNPTDNEITLDFDNYVAEMTSLKYDSSGSFSGGETELLIASGGSYGPVYQHRNIALETPGTRVKLYDINGDIWDVPTGSTTVNFRWAGRTLDVRDGSGTGYDFGEFIIDCSNSQNNGLFAGFSDGQQLWVDMDYLAAPHQGAELRLVYDYVPYQGCDVGGQRFQLMQKRSTGIYFNNGTGDGTISITDTSGTSNYMYTPMSPKLPGSFNDYLRDGTLIELSSIGIKRFDTDAIFHAAYELYGYYGGGSLWAGDYTMPSTPETVSRGFLGDPMLQVIFELPAADQTYAEFIMPLLVRDLETDEVFLLLQIGNKGIQKIEEGNIHIDFFRLNEKLLIKD